MISNRELAIIKLIRSSGVGPATFWSLMNLYNQDPELILENLPRLAKAGGKSNYAPASDKEITEELKLLNTIGARYLFYDDDKFPYLLRQIISCPPVLTICGNETLIENLNDKKILAIIGSRNSSFSGRKFAQDIARELSQLHDYVIVSGLARGIDEAAHNGAQDGIAILPCGVDILYPSTSENVYKLIKNNGLLISENPCGSEPQQHSFIVRNRLIAAIAHGTLVVEANVKSGSLITAKYAKDFGRKIFAVPGDPQDPRKKGTNSLIKNGDALLVESAIDIAAVIESSTSSFAKETERIIMWNSPNEEATREESVRKAKEAILAMINSCPVPIEWIADTLQLDIRTTIVAVVQLELAGKIKRFIDNSIATSDKPEDVNLDQVNLNID